jgi:hypothetical protein
LGSSCRNWFPVMMVEPAHPEAVPRQIRDDERFTSSMSIAACSMTTLACFPSKNVRVNVVLWTDRRQMRTINNHGDLVVDGLHFVINAGHSTLDALHPVVNTGDFIVDGSHPIVDTRNPIVDGSHLVADAGHPVIDTSYSIVNIVRSLQNLSSSHAGLLICQLVQLL